MRIVPDGKVLVGTTSNSYTRGKFTVFGTPGNPATTGTNADNVAIRVATNTGNSQSFDIGMYNASPYGAWLQASNSGGLDSHSPIILNPNGGNVGIGTESPLGKLHVRDGSAQSGISHTYIYDGSAISVEATEPSLQLMAEDSGTHGGSLLWRYGNNAFAAIANPTTDAIDFTYGVSTANDFQVHSGTNMSSYKKIMSIGGDGNVGIGTPTPQSKLDVKLGNNETASIGGTISAGTYAGLRFGYSEAGNSNYRHSAIVFERDDASFGDARGNVHILNSPSGSTSADLGDARLTILPSGNIGIGTTSPGTKLDVVGSVRVQAGSVWSETTQGGNPGSIHIDPNSATDHAGGSITFGASDTSSGTNAQAGIYVRSDGNYGTKMYLSTTDSYAAGSKTAMMIDHAGNVGIGNTNPKAKLQVEVLGIETNQSSVTSTSQFECESFPAADFRSARYTVQVTNVTDSTYHVTEILLIHDGTTPAITEFATIFTGSAAEATFDADITSGNVRLLATPASTDSMQFKVVRHSILV